MSDSKPYAGRLRKAEWEVRPCSLAVAESLIQRLHYAQGGSNTEVYCHALFERRHPARPRGVAWWIPPTKHAARATYPCDWRGVLALSRFVIDEGVPKNAASFLLSRSMRAIDRLRWPCLVTYADEWQEHRGTIYLATGWTFVCFTAPEPTWTLHGRMISRKAGPKTRTVAEMRKLGAEMIGRYRRLKFIHIVGAGPRQERQAELFPKVEA